MLRAVDGNLRVVEVEVGEDEPGRAGGQGPVRAVDRDRPARALRPDDDRVCLCAVGIEGARPSSIWPSPNQNLAAGRRRVTAFSSPAMLLTTTVSAPLSTKQLA